MGIGKTEWGRGVAEGLGISGRIVSPTFLYVQQYESSFDSPAPGFLHADWDRVTNGAEDLEESLLDGMEKRITLVEWGEKLPDSVKESFPMIVHVALSWDGDGRRIQMAWRSSRSFEGPLLKWQSGFGSCIRKLEGVQAV
jgi:tRNA A37 threonylcarbamoyladenosine biosynthesis protein TsaE